MKKEIYFKVAKRQFALSASIWLFFWLCGCFVRWNIFNPFQWLLDMPRYTIEDRLGILMSLIMYYGISIALIYESVNPKSN